VRSLVLDALPLFSTFLIYLPAVFAPSVFHPHGSQVCAEFHLCASWSTPWGIITANFVWDDYLNNLAPQFVYFVIIFICCATLTRIGNYRRKAYVRSALLIWFSSLLSISVYVVVSTFKGGETYGYSAVGYATAGTATGLALFFAVRDLLAKRKTRGFGFLFLFISCLAPLFVLGPHIFFGISYGSNYFVHIYSFLLSLFGSYYISKDLRLK
jgi:hypothetical protein